MPVVTVDPSVTQRYELKTALADPNDPEDKDGFVMLRALPYGMKLTRRDKATKMMMKSQPTNRDGRRGNTPTDSVVELESYNEWAVAYDFAYCIVDHNLTDNNKQPINFQNAMALKQLNPRVGSEIEKLINTLNEDEDELTIEDFPMRSNTLSVIGQEESE